MIVLPAVRCRLCSEHRNPAEFIGNPQVGYCLRCYERHVKALDVLAGNSPSGCDGCGRTYAELESLTTNGDVRFELHIRDGVYSLLCADRCSREYARKRRDFYAQTPYGKALNVC